MLRNILVSYQVSGEGQPLIFLHASFYDSSGYSGLIRILTKKYKVYAIDMPLHGKSASSNKQMNIGYMRSILEEFIICQKIKDPIIYAHSAGSLVAIDYCSRHKAKHLVLIEPAGIHYYNSFFLFLFKVVVLKTIISFIENPIKAFELGRVGFHNLARNIGNKHFWHFALTEIKKDYSLRLAKINCRVTLFLSPRDEMIPYKLTGEFCKNLKNYELITVNGTHDWPILKPWLIEKYI